MRIWLQAVSVGEVLAIGPLIEALQENSSIEIVLTTTTSTGYAEACKRYADKVSRIGIFPLDFWLFSRIAWRRIRPAVVILTESELWPEHLHQAKKREVPAFLVNARISDTSFQRYQQVPTLARRMLNKFQAVYAASDLDQERLIELGCSKGRVSSPGSIKFDVAIEEPLNQDGREALRASLGFPSGPSNPFILLGSSTWPGEEEALLDVQRRLIEEGIDCRLLLVPRHAERGPELVQLLKQQDLSWHQRSSAQTAPENVQIHLADTTGELAHLTQATDLAFIGKSLAPNSGGQTPIEAAGLGTPILMGPNMNNFKKLANSLASAGAANWVSDTEELFRSVRDLAREPDPRDTMQQAGLNWHANNRGSSRRIVEDILHKLNLSR